MSEEIAKIQVILILIVEKVTLEAIPPARKKKILFLADIMASRAARLSQETEKGNSELILEILVKNMKML